MICKKKHSPKILSALSYLPCPIAIEALGAPPLLTKAAKADTIKIIGIHTPTPVKAKLPLPGI